VAIGASFVHLCALSSLLFAAGLLTGGEQRKKDLTAAEVDG
jgi:hypothetical protein